MKSFTCMAALLLIAAAATAQLAPSHAVPMSAPVVKAPASAGNPTMDKPVARVNGVVLTNRDLLRMEYAIFPYAKQHGGMPRSMEPQIRQGALDMIIFEELVYQEALRRKLQIPPVRLSKAEAAFRAQFPNSASFQDYLKAEFKGSRQDMRNKIRRSLLIEAVMKEEVRNRSLVTLAEAKAFYTKNPARFKYEESYAFQSISILPPDNATPAQVADARKRAESVYKQAKASKNYEEFGLLAEKISEDDFRVNMGDHRRVPKAKMPPEVLQAIATMAPGQVSDLLQLGTAYTVFRLNGHTPAGEVSFEAVKKQLRQDLQKEKYNQRRAALGKRLRGAAKVEVL